MPRPTPDLKTWLAGIGLGAQAELFAANGIDWDVLGDLSDADLKELGLSLGDRKRLLKAIASLDGPPTPAAVTSDATPAPQRGEAERRQLTVMFADLVGSTAMAQAMDPEELRGVIRGFQDAAAGAIARYEGHVAKFMGDGVLAYFGWPRAHEDDAERAVRAALALIEATTAAPRQLALRIGIATGVVVVGDVVGEGGAREEAAVGETLNLAARLQQLADAGTIAVAPETRALLGHVFELSSLGPRALKGIAGEVEAWRVLGERRIETRFEAARGPHLGRLVGREQELALALARWELAKAGEGQVVLLRAEPGIGKSRLVAELRQRLEPEAAASLRYQGSPHHTSSVLYPIIQQLLRAARVEAEDGAEAKLAKLAELAQRSRIDAGTAVPLLASLLSIPASGEFALPQMSAQQQKAETLSLLQELLAGLAKDGPVLMVVEDLHWIDPTTRELLDQTVARLETLPVLLLVTFRPEIASPWEGRGHVTLITLNRLGRRQVEAQIADVAQRRALPAELVDQIAAKSDGVPLFVEELTKSVLEAGAIGDHGASADRLPQLAVPTSLRASLLARLDRLPAAREIAQVGAALGREFDFDLLAAVMPHEETQVIAALEALHRAELLFPRGAPPRTRWSFKHALIQDAAYETMLKASRSALHARIAEAITTRFPALAETEPETVARHYEDGGNATRSFAFWRGAGRRALSRDAGSEAIEHFGRSIRQATAASASESELLDLRVSLGEAQYAAGRILDSIATLTETTDRARETRDLVALARSSACISLAAGQANQVRPQTVELLEEVLATGEPIDDSLRIRVLMGLAHGLIMVGNFERLAEVTDSMIALARRLNDHHVLSEAIELSFYTPATVLPEQVPEIRRRGNELVDVARAGGTIAVQGRALDLQFFLSAQIGDIASLRCARSGYQELANAQPTHFRRMIVGQMQAAEATLRGEFADAENAAIEAQGLAERAGLMATHGVYGMQMFAIRREQGRLVEVAPLFKRFIDESREGAAWEPGFALVASDLGFEAPARRTLQKFSAARFSTIPVDAMRSATLAFFAEVAVRLRDREAGAQLLELLQPYRFMTITIGVHVACFGAAGRFLGLLADLLDDQLAAVEHFERALELNAAMEAWPWLAHTQADYAAALRRWGRPTDLARSAELAAAAHATGARLGMVFLRNKLASQLQ